MKFNNIILGGIMCLALSTIAQMAHAKSCRWASPVQRTSLLELYTSEGCSSCPPADEWLRGLKTRGEKVIPLAWHVDYWDYIGWQDRFASARYSERQRNMATLAHSRLVYTPQITLNGRDYRNYAHSEQFRADLAQAAHSEPVILELTARWQSPQMLEVNLRNSESASSLHLVVFENNLQSQVSLGENKGHTLHHDYVVRYWSSAIPAAKQQQSQTIPINPQWKKSDLGIALFAQATNGEIRQAIAGMLKECF